MSILKTLNHLQSNSFIGVRQGSVFGPLLFILYTIPLTTVISNSAANHHHLHADDIQLSFSSLVYTQSLTL